MANSVDISEALAALASVKDNVKQAIINVFETEGERGVIQARSYNSNTYTDQTGNLRSSVGFRVVSDGEVVSESSFEVVNEGNDGPIQARQVLDEAQGEVRPGTTALIVCAGMNYASYVQDLGKDVTASAELLLDKTIPERLKAIKL